MKHFKIRKDLTKEFFGITLFRIELTVDCKWGKAGDLGGYIEEESNLQDNAWVSGDALVYGNARVYGNALVSGNARVYGNALVSGNAQVYGNARVSGNARVYGNALVSGNAIVEKTPIVISGVKHSITITETHIFIGCERHTINHWKKNIVKIGKANNYTDSEIKQTISLLKALIK